VSGDFAKQGGAHKGEGAHLFAPMGFLDDSNFHRSYWVYGKSFAGGHGGYYQAGKYAPAGRILVHDDKNVYSYGREAQYYKWTTTMEYTLFSTPKTPPEESLHTEDATTQRRATACSRPRWPAARRAAAEARKGRQSREKGRQRRRQRKGKGKASRRPQQSPMPRSRLRALPRRGSARSTKTAISVEAWVLPDTANGTVLHHGGPCSKAIALDIRDKEAATPHPQRHSNSAPSSAPSEPHRWLAPPRWHPAADGKMALYIDGKLVAEGNGKGSTQTRPPLYLGNGDGAAEGSAGGFSGLLDQFALYHKALTPPKCSSALKRPMPNPPTPCSPATSTTATAATAPRIPSHGIGAGVETGKGKVGGALWFKPAVVARVAKALAAS
jgi:hypothetical protein